MSRKPFVLGWIGLFLVVCGCTAEGLPKETSRRIFGEMPDEIEASARYLFYLHGRIIEEKGVRPTHPRFGVYEYREILETFADLGFVVISEVRPSAADVATWAERVGGQVRRLVSGGVPPEHITVVGFSKGRGHRDIRVVGSRRRPFELCFHGRLWPVGRGTGGSRAARAIARAPGVFGQSRGLVLRALCTSSSRRREPRGGHRPRRGPRSVLPPATGVGRRGRGLDNPRRLRLTLTAV